MGPLLNEGEKPRDMFEYCYYKRKSPIGKGIKYIYPAITPSFEGNY